MNCKLRNFRVFWSVKLEIANHYHELQIIIMNCKLRNFQVFWSVKLEIANHYHELQIIIMNCKLRNFRVLWSVKLQNVVLSPECIPWCWQECARRRPLQPPPSPFCPPAHRASWDKSLSFRVCRLNAEESPPRNLHRREGHVILVSYLHALRALWEYSERSFR